MADETTLTPTPPPTQSPEELYGMLKALTPPADDGKLVQAVELSDIGPCKKHIKVTVDRQQIDERMQVEYGKLVKSEGSQIKGFRPGKAPRKIIERRYKSSVMEQVRNEVMMASLEQLATENHISPLSPPDIKIDALVIPDEGPFIYEFDIEVRPEFELPVYKGLKLRRPVKTFTDPEIDREIHRLMEPMGQLVPKEGTDPQLELDDFAICDISVTHQGKKLIDLPEARVRIEKRLVLNFGWSDDFGKCMIGGKAGETRVLDLQLAIKNTGGSMPGGTVPIAFAIKDIKVVRPPVLDDKLLQDKFGVANLDQLRELVEVGLNRRLEYTQRQEFRKQIMGQFITSSEWDLPEDLVRRQAQNLMARQVLEMRNSGMTQTQIESRMRLLQQDVLANAAYSLKEHFFLQKVAEAENIEIVEADIEAEIEHIASESDENPRKVRARMEKENKLDVLGAELLERRALDVILQNAEYEDYVLSSDEDQGELATVGDGSVELPALTDKA